MQFKGQNIHTINYYEGRIFLYAGQPLFLIIISKMDSYKLRLPFKKLMSHYIIQHEKTLLGSPYLHLPSIII